MWRWCASSHPSQVEASCGAREASLPSHLSKRRRTFLQRKGTTEIISCLRVTAQILNLDFNGVFGHLKTFSLSSPNFIKSFGHDPGFGFLLSGYSMLSLNSHILHLIKLQMSFLRNPMRLFRSVNHILPPTKGAPISWPIYFSTKDAR